MLNAPLTLNQKQKKKKEVVTMAEKKITKREMYARILGKLTDENEKAFIEHEMELLAKKNAAKSTKPTATQVANAGVKEEILGVMESGKMYTVSELMKAVPSLNDTSNQKASALIRQLKDEGLVNRVEEKGRAYFSKA